MGLYEKMHQVMVHSTALDKSMEVGTGKNSYKAVSESAVLGVVKPLLKEYGLVIFPINCEVSESHTAYEGKYGTTQRFLTTLKVTYKIVDIESGEFDLLQSVGYGTDTQDKASGQAMTYAYKSMLQKTFCLFSGDDTDNTHSEDKNKQSSFKKGNEVVEKVVGEKEINKLNGIAKDKGITGEMLEQLAQHKFKCPVNKMNLNQYVAVLKYVSSK